jgi:hypothetical protein
MNRIIGKSQSGYMLLMFVLLLMGIGGVVTAGFTQNVKKFADHERFLHNERVLKEAKQALLMYAYRYPETALAFNGTIPGRCGHSQSRCQLYCWRQCHGRAFSLEREWHAIL